MENELFEQPTMDSEPGEIFFKYLRLHYTSIPHLAGTAKSIAHVQWSSVKAIMCRLGPHETRNSLTFCPICH